MSAIRRMVMNEVAEYPIFNMDVLWAGDYSVKYYKLSALGKSKSVLWSKLSFTFDALDKSALKAAIGMKTLLSLNILHYSYSTDSTYFELLCSVKDTKNRQTSTTIPVIVDSSQHELSLETSTIGTEYLLSSLISMDSFYDGFILSDCKILSPYIDRDILPQYTDSVIEVYEDRIKIIGEVLLAKAYALVDTVHKRAMTFHFVDPSAE